MTTSRFTKKPIFAGLITAVLAVIYLGARYWVTGSMPETNTAYLYWYPGIESDKIVSYTTPVSISLWWEVAAGFAFGFLFQAMREAFSDLRPKSVFKYITLVAFAIGLVLGLPKGAGELVSHDGFAPGIIAWATVCVSIGTLLALCMGIVAMFKERLAVAFLTGLYVGLIFGLAHSFSLGIMLTLVYGFVTAAIWYAWQGINSAGRKIIL